MSRASGSDILANPVLVGAATVLVGLVALLLSYNANSGLPFVPTYDVRAVVPDAAELTPGNEVRIGGKRVGLVTAIVARQSRDGRTTARLDLKLDKVVEPLPRDTRVTVRPRSPLGLRYLELRPGRSRTGIPAGGTLPLERARPVVVLDEVIDALDAPTRRSLQGTVSELGDALAGRGGDLNRSIASFPRLFSALEAVAANLSDRRTDLHGLVSGLAATTAALRPVSGRLGDLFDGAATTLAAVAGVREQLGETLAEAPATLTVATGALRRIRPVTAQAAALARELEPGSRLLPTASRRLAGAIEVGTPVLRRAVGLADRLDALLAELDRLARNPSADGSVRKLTEVVASLRPTLEFVNPFQTRCNYLGIWTRNASSAISEGDANGTWFRFFPIYEPDEIAQRADPAPRLHVNQYPHTGSTGECEAGNEPYLPGRQIGNVPGNQGDRTETTAPPPGVGR